MCASSSASSSRRPGGIHTAAASAPAVMRTSPWGMAPASQKRHHTCCASASGNAQPQTGSAPNASAIVTLRRWHVALDRRLVSLVVAIVRRGVRVRSPSPWRRVGLAGVGAGRVAEKELAGHLVAGDQCGSASCSAASVEHRRAAAELDERDNLLAEALVGQADDDRVEHVGVGADRGLDLFGEDLLAAGVDAARAPAEQHDVARRRRSSPSRRARPSARRCDRCGRSRGLLGIVPVPERDVAAPREQPFHARSRFERLERVGVEHPRAAVGRERRAVARGARPDLAARGAGFRRAVAVVQHRARERTRELRLHRRAQHRAAVAEPMIDRESQRSGSREHGFGERARHRVADDADRRRALASRRGRAPRRRRSPLAVDDRPVAAEQRDQRQPWPPPCISGPSTSGLITNAGSALRAISAGALIGSNGLPPRQHA